MNKKKLFLGTCGILLCLAGGGAFAINHFIDRKVVLQQLSDTIEKQTGRKLTLQNLDIHFLPWPEIQASKITLSNMPDGKNPYFITAGHLKADLNLWSLWQNKVHFSSVQLSHVDIHLEKNEQGQKNWNLQPIETTQNNTKEDKPYLSHRKWQWQFNDIKLDHVDCWYDDAYAHRNTHLFFQDVEINQLESDKVKFNINGSHHEADFTISGRINHLNELLDTQDIISHPSKFQINLTEYIRKQNIGNLRVSGTLKSLVQAKGYDIILRGTILNLNDLNHLFPHAHLPSIENITLSAAIKDTAPDNAPQAKPQINQLQLHTGNIESSLPSDLRLISTEIIANDLNSTINTQVVGQLYGTMFRWSGNLGQLKKIQDILLFQTDKSIPITGKLSSANYNIELDGTVGSKSPLLGIKLNLLNYNRYIEGLGDFNAQNILYNGKVVIAFPITLSFLKNITKETLLDITTEGKLSSNSIKINQFLFNHFSSNLLWKDKELTLSQLQLSNKQSNIKGEAVYSVKQATPLLTVKINPSFFPMKWVEDMLRIKEIYTGQIQAIGYLYAIGSNWQTWQQSLTGKLGISGVNGKLEAQGLKHYIGKAAQTLPMKNSLSTQCIAIRTQINQSNLYFDTLTIQTDQFALNGQGDFNIPDQKLNLHIIPDVRLGAISASAPLRIGGTLSNPYATFDKNKSKVFSLNINSLMGSQPQKNYCSDALEKARNPSTFSQNK